MGSDSNRQPPQNASLEAMDWTSVLGLQLQVVSAREVTATWSVSARHLQPHGIIHGGVHCSVVETLCSIGAQLAAPSRHYVVGLENHTSFVKAIREGVLTARATPVHAGRTAQLWECEIRDAKQSVVATGRLRLLCLKEAKS